MFDTRWLAGFFDGEGSVSIAHSPNGRKDGSRTYRLQVAIAQKNPGLLSALKAELGGTISNIQLILQGPVAERFLRRIQPYSVVKDKVIALALAYRETVCCRGSLKGVLKGFATTPHLIELKRAAFRAEIMRLNKAN